MPSILTNYLRRYIHYSGGCKHSLKALQAPLEAETPSPEIKNLYLKLFRKQHISTKRFLDDLVALLQSLAAAIRSGMDPILALERCGSSLGEHSYLAKEVALLINKMTDEAVPLHSALKLFANEINDPCLDLFKHALKLAHDDGASISTCLQRLSRVTRQRQSFDRKVKSALAMQKLSTIGLLACASMMLMTQALTNFEAITRVFSNPLSLLVMTIGLILLFSGGLMMAMLAKKSFA